MKKLALALLFVVAIGMNSNATTNEISVTTNHVLDGTKVSTICKLIQLGDIDGVKNLIENGTNINQKSCGMTPLMYAARQNKTEIVELLISRGANLKTRSDKGLTALQYAEQSKAVDSYNVIAKAMNA